MERFREIAPGVLVATSELLTCTSTVVAAGDGGCHNPGITPPSACPSHMLDNERAPITDLGHAYRHKPGVIMTKIREESARGG